MARRVVVVGAGAIGAGLGGALARRGRDVVFVARGEHGRVLRTDGVSLRWSGGRATVRVPTVHDVSDVSFRDDDLVLICVMGQHTAEVAASLPPGQAVVSLQNGTGPRDRLVAAGHPTTAAVVYVPAERVAPGQVILSAAPHLGTVWLGAWPTGAGADAHDLAAALAEAGFVTRVTADVAPWIRAKTLADLGGVVVALCDAPPSDVVTAARDEAVAVWSAAGREHRSLDALVAAMGPLRVEVVDGHIRQGGATRHALRRGQALETHCLHEPVVTLGEQVGVQTPVNRALIAAAEHVVAAGEAPGSWSAGRLRRWVGRA